MDSQQSVIAIRRIWISSVITCIYLPIIITFISYNGLLYSVGKGSSFFILVLLFVAEVLKSIYVNSDIAVAAKKNKQNRNVIGEILKQCIFMLVNILIVFITLILLGAPAYDRHEETLMLATLLTILTVFPLTIRCGVGQALEMLFMLISYECYSIDAMYMDNALMTLIGTWLGAVVIPLDWNAPWQEWPISCYLGALGGYMLSNLSIVGKTSLLVGSLKYPLFGRILRHMDRFD